MTSTLWTVARFPNGSWSTGGTPDSPGYDDCEIWQIEATTREAATKKAQAHRSHRMLKAKKAAAQMARKFKGEK